MHTFIKSCPILVIGKASYRAQTFKNNLYLIGIFSFLRRFFETAQTLSSKMAWSEEVTDISIS